MRVCVCVHVCLYVCECIDTNEHVYVCNTLVLYLKHAIELHLPLFLKL